MTWLIQETVQLLHVQLDQADCLCQNSPVLNYNYMNLSLKAQFEKRCQNPHSHSVYKNPVFLQYDFDQNLKGKFQNLHQLLAQWTIQVQEDFHFALGHMMLNLHHRQTYHHLGDAKQCCS